MSETRPLALSISQQVRLNRYRVEACFDIHCHCLPGVDDGPEDWDEALLLCRELVADGITDVIATPHQLGRYEGANTASLVRQRVTELNEELDYAAIPLRVHPGGDVRIDERLPAMLDDDVVLTIADNGRFVLIELPDETLLDPRPMMDSMPARSMIVTHPERHPFLQRKPNLLAQWVRDGLIMQVTAGSLLGDFGSLAQDVAWEWMEQGLVGLVATDAHNLEHRVPRMSAAIDIIAEELGDEVAKQVCLVNPYRVAHGQAIPAALIIDRNF